MEFNYQLGIQDDGQQSWDLNLEGLQEHNLSTITQKRSLLRSLRPEVATFLKVSAASSQLLRWRICLNAEEY